MSDRSLDEFARDSELSDGENETDDGSESAADDSPGSETVDPAVATAAVSPGGAPCDSCDETATRRWHDDGQYVCGDCKAWEG